MASIPKLEESVTGPRLCLASTDTDEALTFLRSNFSEIKEGRFFAEISGVDGVSVFVCLRPDRVPAAVLERPRKTDPLSHN